MACSVRCWARQRAMKSWFKFITLLHFFFWMLPCYRHHQLAIYAKAPPWSLVPNFGSSCWRGWGMDLGILWFCSLVISVSFFCSWKTSRPWLSKARSLWCFFFHIFQDIFHFSANMCEFCCVSLKESFKDSSSHSNCGGAFCVSRRLLVTPWMQWCDSKTPRLKVAREYVMHFGCYESLCQMCQGWSAAISTVAVSCLVAVDFFEAIASCQSCIGENQGLEAVLASPKMSFAHGFKADQWPGTLQHQTVRS